VTINNFQFDNKKGINDLAIRVAARAVGYGMGFGTQGLSKYDLSQEKDMNSGVPGPKGTADWLRLFQQYAQLVPLEAQTICWSQPDGGGQVGSITDMIVRHDVA